MLYPCSLLVPDGCDELYEVSTFAENAVVSATELKEEDEKTLAKTLKRATLVLLGLTFGRG